MDPVILIALEVGTTKERLVGKYAGGKLSVELEKPAQFGKLSDLLKQYDVPVASWPSFLQDALALEAWLWAINYHTLTLGTTSSTTLAAKTFATGSGITFPAELEGAEIVANTASQTYSVKKNGVELKYSATKNDHTYTIEANVYQFVVQGAYETPFTIIKGLLSLKSIAFGITNDPAIDVAAFEKACRNVLDSKATPTALPTEK